MPQAFPGVVAAVKAFAAKTFVVAGIKITGAFILKAAAYAALTIGSTLYSRNLAKKAMSKAVDPGRTLMIREPAAPRQIIYGQVRTSGPLVFVHTTGAKNEMLWLIVALAGHECEEIGTVYFDDNALTLDGSGNVTSAPYAGKATIYKYLGTDSQTANAALITAAPTKWTSAHRLRGITYVLVRLEYDTDVFPGGIPNVSAIVKGRKILDTRTSTTAWSANWALCVRDYLTHPTLGLNVAAGEIDVTALNAAANVADENVPLDPSGTEKRYTINGVVMTSAQPGTVLEQMVVAGAGFCSYIGGKWIIHAGAYRTPTVTLTENDLRGPISIQTKVSRREIFNGVKGLFFSPDNQWQAADFPPVVNATYTTEDGERIWQDVELPFTTSNATAQRLAKIALERVRQQITIRMPCKLTALRVQAGDNVKITNARMGWNEKVFEVTELVFAGEEQEGGAQALGVDLALRETASGVWDWADGEETTIDLAPNTDLPNPRVVAAPTSLVLTSDGTTTQQQQDGTVVPAIKVAWTAPSDEFVQSGGLIRIEYKLAASATYLPWDVPRGDATEDFIDAIIVGESYNVRIRAENTLGARSAWVTGTITAAGVTAGPATPTGLAATSSLESITLNWDDNTELNLRDYQVARNTVDNVGTATIIDTALTSRFVDTLAAASTLYYYWLRAVNRAGIASGYTASVNATRTEQSGGGGFLLDASGASSGIANDTVYTAISGSLTGVADLRRHECVFIVTVPFASPEDLQGGTIRIKRGASTIGSASIPLIVVPGSATVSFTVNDTIPAGSQSYAVEIEATSTGLSADYSWTGYLKVF